MTTKTIAACSTGNITSGVGVIRVSGSDATEVIDKFFQSRINPITNPRVLCLGKFIVKDEILDHCMAVYFNAPESYTGEDTVEFHVHGNPILIKNILDEIFKIGIIPAEPGEFTQLAFLNGKIDLVQAESVGEIIHASNTKALRLAQENLRGKLTTILDSITEPLRDSLAEVEANIDFTDEDIAPETQELIFNNIKEVKVILEKLLNTFKSSQAIKEGIRVLIFGKPNTGKSSLLNRLLNRERAIVSNIPGTTRDLIEEQIQIEDLSFVFTDSAGIRDSGDHVENLGVKLALDNSKTSDLILILIDQNTTREELTELTRKIPEDTSYWVIKNKSDLKKEYLITNHDQSISVQNNLNIEQLIQKLVEFGKFKTSASETAYITNARQKNYLELSYKTICEIQKEDQIEILSFKIRAALSALDEIVGKTHTEDILGRIFSKFCIGK